MKKYYLSFLTFIIAFISSLIFIYYKANPINKLSNEENMMEWHGQVENEYGTYDGALIGDLFSGDGSFQFLSGETYVGEWSESYMSGEGEVIFPNIGRYSGEMNESKRNGNGTFTWDTGDKYVGEWEDDVMSGNGKYSFSNGMFFEGVMENNKPVSGTLTYESQFTEELADDKILSFEYIFAKENKHIKFTTKGGLEYDGDISGLNGSGEAEVVYPSGNKYMGALLQGKRSGKGEFTWFDEDGHEIACYVGEWKEDIMNGNGTYTYSSSVYPYITGYFKDGVPSGNLIYYKSAGNAFITKWEDGICQSIEEK